MSNHVSPSNKGILISTSNTKEIMFFWISLLSLVPTFVSYGISKSLLPALIGVFLFWIWLFWSSLNTWSSLAKFCALLLLTLFPNYPFSFPILPLPIFSLPIFPLSILSLTANLLLNLLELWEGCRTESFLWDPSKVIFFNETKCFPERF